jgi:DNA modification methylase
VIRIYSEDCIDKEKKIKDGSVDLGIFDPPFGIGETGFNKHYKRDSSNVIQGYKEAPDDYEQWTHLWLAEAKRVLKENGSMYVIMGHSKLRHVLNAAHNLGLHEINHIIWK